MQNVKAEPSLGIQVEQCLVPGEGLLEKLESRLHDAGIDEVILALAPDELGVTADVIQVCEKCGTKPPSGENARTHIQGIRQSGLCPFLCKRRA